MYKHQQKPWRIPEYSSQALDCTETATFSQTFLCTPQMPERPHVLHFPPAFPLFTLIKGLSRLKVTAVLSLLPYAIHYTENVVVKPTQSTTKSINNHFHCAGLKGFGSSVTFVKAPQHQLPNPCKGR